MFEAYEFFRLLRYQTTAPTFNPMRTSRQVSGQQTLPIVYPMLKPES